MVTVFALDHRMVLQDDSGWWADFYSQVITSKIVDQPLILVIQKTKAMTVALKAFAKSPTRPARPTIFPPFNATRRPL